MSYSKEIDRLSELYRCLKARNSFVHNPFFLDGRGIHDWDANASAATDAYQLGIEKFADLGRFGMAARYQKELAEMQESTGLLKEAVKSFRQAADLYESENQTSAANQCLLKVAQYSAQLEDYATAIEIYERVGTNSLSNNLLRFSAKDHFFRAGLCHLAEGDLLAAKRAVERYQDLDVSFAREREHKLLLNIIAAMEACNQDNYTTAVAEYNQICKLDEWKTTILLRIKSNIKMEDALT